MSDRPDDATAFANAINRRRLSRQSTDRMTVIRSRILACNGRCSQNLTPGTRVAIVPKGPRVSTGASGFGSHVSRWLGPPESQNRMTALWLDWGAAAA